MSERVFALPDLGEGLEEATVDAWLVREGEEITRNQPLVEIETAKATVEIPSPFTGRVTRLHASPGQTIAVGAPLVTFEVETDGMGGGGSASRVAATPAVRKLAKELEVDLRSVGGTGPGGRVTREDVERAAARSGAERRPLSPVRARIVANLERAAAIPQVTTFRTVDCTELEAYRRELELSPLPLVTAAVAATAARHPGFRSTFEDGSIVVHDDVAVGIATDTERGLLVPVLRDTVDLGVASIAAAIDRLAVAARDGSIGPEALRGATITITNTGSYGSEAGTPLLNPPGAVTIGLGLVAPRAIVVEGQVVARPACTLSVTFDHRVLGGAEAGRAVNDLVAVLEDRDRLRGLPGRAPEPARYPAGR